MHIGVYIQMFRTRYEISESEIKTFYGTCTEELLCFLSFFRILRIFLTINGILIFKHKDSIGNKFETIFLDLNKNYHPVAKFIKQQKEHSY